MRKAYLACAAAALLVFGASTARADHYNFGRSGFGAYNVYRPPVIVYSHGYHGHHGYHGRHGYHGHPYGRNPYHHYGRNHYHNGWGGNYYGGGSYYRGPSIGVGGRGLSFRIGF